MKEPAAPGKAKNEKLSATDDPALINPTKKTKHEIKATIPVRHRPMAGTSTCARIRVEGAVGSVIRGASLPLSYTGCRGAGGRTMLSTNCWADSRSPQSTTSRPRPYFLLTGNSAKVLGWTVLITI